MTSNSESSFLTTFLAGGEMAGRVRDYDWSTNPLGPVAGWSPGLQSALSICLHSNFPIAIYWGEKLTLLYNDAWSPIPGKKHPWALGKPAIEVWPDIWNEIKPQFDKAFSGIPGGSQDALLPMQRHGYTEECYFDFTFTPILGSSGKVEGIFNAVIETTYRVMHHRRTTFLQKFSARLNTVYEQQELFDTAITTIKENPLDIPFCMFYSSPETGLLSGTHNRNEFLRIEELIFAGHQHYIEDITGYLDVVPPGPWPEPPKEAFIVPLKSPDGTLLGYMLAGVSSRHRFDNEYQLFFENTAGSLMAVLNTIRSLQQERQKASMLAEIDRAKTIFFSNISHEFRTPLTLLLGPVEEVLNDPSISADQRFRLEIVMRNARRMQKLVNNLLDFSRIEAGRMQASFSKTDIASYTAELAGNFRSAIEKAGLSLDVKTDPVTDEVYLDHDMWEKIIFNLLSNALKFTKKGRISLSVSHVNTQVVVTVSDTGIGIPPGEINKIFERFHRVEGSSGRSQEGTGIGLAMVQELVRLQGGEISAQSEPGVGSTFVITIPTGKKHIPAEQVTEDISSVGNYTSALLDEATGWAANSNNETHGISGSHTPGNAGDNPGNQLKQTILLAEDNADMRAYLVRLLKDQFNLVTAVDGEQAFNLLSTYKPDLIISDIMMPVLDGLGLLKKLRADPDFRNTPLILLSARAGEEAMVEGINAGADDYLVKPFSPKELMARVTGCLRMQEIRRKTEEQYYNLFMQAPAIINIFKGPEFRYILYHPKNKSIFGDKDFTGMTLEEAIPDIKEQGLFDMLTTVYNTGKSVSLMERGLRVQDENGEWRERFFNLIYQPWFDSSGEVQGILNFALEVTEMVETRRRIEESEQYFRRLTDTVPATIWITGVDGRCQYLNKSWYDITGQTTEEAEGFGWLDATHPDDKKAAGDAFVHSSSNQVPYNALFRLRQKDGSYRWSLDRGEPRYDAQGHFEGFIGSVLDVHDEKIARDLIQESEEQFRNLAETLPQLVWMTDHEGKQIYASSRWEEYTGMKPSPENWSLMVHPDDLEKITEKWTNSLTNGQVYQGELRFKRRDGIYNWFYVQGVPVLKEDGSIARWIGSFTDIQDQKTTEQKLEELVADRTRQLQRSNNDLQQFAHVASHDLKEPLRKIRTFAGRLAEDTGSTLSEKGIQYLRKLNGATARMLLMIDGVLRYSSLNGEEQILEVIDIQEVIRQVEVDLELLIQQKNATIICGKFPEIEGATVLIYQVFYNLINNSLKFSDAVSRPPQIMIQGELLNEDTLMIKVSDNGIGFDADFAEKIFDAFTRLNSRDHFEGTGLGLSLCKRIIERHGGSIRAEGHQDAGASFIITLPLKQTKGKML